MRPDGKRQRILLHACCAPCTTHPFRVLSRDAEVTVFFYNPNIQPGSEYRAREEEIRQLAAGWKFDLVTGPYDAEGWNDAVRGMEDAPEGGERCTVCFRMRLEAAAREAVKRGCDGFTTTLSVSPHKNAALINALGRAVGAENGIAFVEADFKKKDGYRESCRISREEGLYRQDYCGCLYSRREARERKRR